MTKFFVSGDPQGKGRPKFSTRGSYVTAYTPKKTVDYENHIKECYYNAEIKHVPWVSDEPLKCDIHVVYPIPKSTTKKERKRMLEGLRRPTKKPDLDNIAKIVLDALNGVAYGDDKQIVELHMTSCFGEEPGLVVTIEEFEND